MIPLASRLWGVTCHWQLPGVLRSFTAAPAQSLALIKDLREKSGAPISDVKACLVQANWQVEEAYELLRKKGLAAAAKKASRHASEGLVGLATAPGLAAIVEINSETDFVSRNHLFTDLVTTIAKAALEVPKDAVNDKLEVDIAAFEKLNVPSHNISVGDMCSSVAAQVRENIKLRRAYLVSSQGVIGTYIHNSVAPGLGRIAGVVALQQPGTTQDLPSGSREAIAEFANNVAMHSVGYNALYLNPASVPEEVLAKERQILSAQAAATAKSPTFVDKIVEGRLKKWYEESCLTDQKFMFDDKVSVTTAVNQISQQHNIKPSLQLELLLRVRVGEGLETVEQDFAAEVAGMAGSS